MISISPIMELDDFHKRTMNFHWKQMKRKTYLRYSRSNMAMNNHLKISTLKNCKKKKPKSLLTEVFHFENILKNINTAFTLLQQPSSEA
jgi:hypothetical protein